MKKVAIFLAIMLLICSTAYADWGDWIKDGIRYTTARVLEIVGQSEEPPTSAANNASIYFDSDTAELYVSKDGAAYEVLGSGGGGATALNDLTDVDTTGVADTKILKYSSADGKWIIGNDNTGAGGTITLEDLSAISPIDYNNATGVFSLDGYLTEDDVTLTDVQNATSNDFHNIGGVDADTTYTAGTGMSLAGTVFNCTVTDTDTTYDAGWGLVLDATTFSLSPSVTNGLVLTSDTTAWDKNASDDFSWDYDYGDLINKPTIPTVDDTAYNATSWNGNTDAATKNAIRDKIESLGSSGEENVQVDWNESDTGSDAYILNKPTIPTNNNQLTNGAGYITSADDTVSGSELDGVFSSNGLLKRTGTATYTVDTNTYLTAEVDGSVTNEIEVVDEAYSSANFNGGTTSAVSQDDFYDLMHIADTDDDGLPNRIDTTSNGFVKAGSSNGTLSISATVGDTEIAAGAVDGGTGGEIQDGSITSADLGTDSVSADELNATGVEAELEAVLDLQDLQGAVTDAQVPNDITITESDPVFVAMDTLAELDTQIGLTGTADGTTYLRGDGAWATPAGGSGLTNLVDTAGGVSTVGANDDLSATGVLFTNHITSIAQSTNAEIDMTLYKTITLKGGTSQIELKNSNIILNRFQNDVDTAIWSDTHGDAFVVDGATGDVSMSQNLSIGQDVTVNNNLDVTNTAKADNVQVAGDTMTYTADFYIAQQDADAVGTDLSISNMITVSGVDYVEIGGFKIGQDLTTDGTNVYFKGTQL